MTWPHDFEVTSEMLWTGSLIFALIDSVFIPLLAWRIPLTRFRRLRWTLVITAAGFWSLLWAWVLNNFWESVYRHFFPDWTRPFLPFFFGLFYAIVALVLWLSAWRMSSQPVVVFCFLGGLWGMVTHAWAVYRGIVDKPPMLQGASPVAAVVIAMFEFMFYWCVILSIACLLWHGWQWARGPSRQGGMP